jgi:hypothetical protein
MRVRLKDKPQATGRASSFNVHAMFEIVMYFDGEDGFDGCDSVYGSDVEVFVTKLGAWKTLSQAMKDRDVITDNLNTEFFEPANDADRERGFAL